ncbi:Trehalose-6-P synthase/phosphatase complex subunit [Cystobasidiomycetes sp. EMM_F5]
MAKPAGSRLVIATLFLPETVNFDEPASPLPPPSEQLHDEDEPVNGDASASNDGSRIKTGASNSVAWPTSRTALSEDVAARPLSPIIASQPGTPNGQQSHFPLSFDGQNAPSAAENSRAKPSSQPGARQTNALQLAAMPSIQAIQSESSGRATSTLGVPTRPPLAGRGMSILDDLRTKATATPGVPIPKVTPSDLSLGYNPFEAALSAGAAPPVPTLPTTPSLQASIAMRRPNPARLLSEGHPSLGLSNSRYGGASNRDGVSGAGGILGRDASKPGEHGGSILTRTPAQSTDKTSPLSGMAATAQSQRPRATSITRPGSATGTGPGQLTRTFSRSGRRDSHRRRSSTASAAGMHGGSDSGLTTPLTPYGSQPGLPQFYLESNPHGNGGLQNAVRSVADAHIRTASDPIPPRLGRSAPERASTGEVAAEDRPIRSTHVSSIPSAKDGIREYRWVGTIGCGIGELDEPLRNAIDTKYREEKRSHAVWVEDDVLEPAYDMFCKQILWPTFHYQVHDVHKTKAYQSPAWKDYVAMNQAFADKIVSVYKKGDLIWINDYHLMLVPNMVRHKLPDATIGFFLHIAFPSSEIFRCLANRRELLEGVLGADLIGFQTYNLARHFRQTCQRLLSVEAIPRGIQLQNGFAKVGVFSIGIDVKALHERKREAEVGEWLKILREQYKGMRILMARDKLDEIKGVRQKLVAYEYFLEHNPEYVGKVVLIQVAMATSEENEKQGDVMDLVSRINARFSTFS